MFNIILSSTSVEFNHICFTTEELEDSVLLPLLADHQNEPQEHISQAARDFTPALLSADSSVPPAGLSHLLTECAEPQSSLIESSDSQSPTIGALSFSLEPSVPAEDLPRSSPVDLIPSLVTEESTADRSPPQAIEDTLGSVDEIAEPLHVASAHHCDHEHDDE